MHTLEINRHQSKFDNPGSPIYSARILLFFILFFALRMSPETNAAERPHIILIMVDDMGFSDLGYMGGEIATPHLDALASRGVRFSQFYNSGRCCPTRATLMTGLHPHQAGIGWMTEPPHSRRGENEPPAYQGHLNESCFTIAEALHPAGYATLMAGKWHLGYNDKSDWPLQRGFEKYYGCIAGATRFFHPEHPRGMTKGNELIENPVSATEDAFYTTDAFTDYAIRFLKEERAGENRPSFLYLAYTAPHWPLQAFEKDIAKYRKRYADGWDKIREKRFARQKELGLFSNDTVLSPRTPGIPDWESLDEKKRNEMDLKMAVYAAMIDRIDQNIGKLVDHLKSSGVYNDTLIFFLSDNGACQEGGMLGRGEFVDQEKRNRQDSNSYGEAWANASNTPFRLYKHFAHEGGAATPFFMHWPSAIAAREHWYREPAQLIDIMPTILDVAGGSYPETRGDKPLPTLEGISLRPSFSGEALARNRPLFIEHETNAFVREGKWKLVGRNVSRIGGTDAGRWELYDMNNDRTETRKLNESHPDVAGRLAGKWEEWANRIGIYPRGKGSPPGQNPQPKADPNPPQVQGREFSVTATIRGKNPQGVVVSHGGVQFGYSLHFNNGKPAFSIRDAGKLTELFSDERVTGKAEVTAKLTEETMSILVNGKEVASRKSAGLLTGQPAIGKYIGIDFKDPVGSYKSPNKFNGKILTAKVAVVIPRVKMRTEWGESVTAENAWRDYPRPQLRRNNWTNLNGLWDYAVTGQETTNMPEKADGKILVPFAIEAPLSGVEKRFGPGDALWYRRIIELEKKMDKRVLLNFEAVDYKSKLWINGKEVGSHIGGNLPFSFDITEAVKSGENEIILRVTDATDSAYQLHGKQRLNPKGIWYTPVSGIWQTVWMEEVPNDYLIDYSIQTTNEGKLTLILECSGSMETIPTTITASKNGEEVFKWNGKVIREEFEIPTPQLWSPDSPNLYDLTIQYGDDRVDAYFAFRETGIAKDAEGHWRFTINGAPIFHWGTLDQGWWPDGLLTPPSDAAMVSDIEFLKEAGFNTIRKHIKIEPRRYYYHCDKIGMLVWQDQVSAKRNDDPKWTRLQPDPQTAVWPVEAHQQYWKEYTEMIHALGNHPSIVQWVPFNERWGQHQTMEVGERAVAADPTRQINIASGGNFFPVGHIVDAHSYPHPAFPFEQGKGGRFTEFVKVMGEFGGHGFPVEGHLWSKTTRNWGYGGLPKNKDEWLERYKKSIRILAELQDQGIAAGIYTQTTDVEGEINGLLTYDRRVQKIAPAELKKIAVLLFE